MITIDDRLYVTKEINTIVVSYAKNLLLRKLLIEVCFESKQNIDDITDLIQSLNFYGMDTKPSETEHNLLERLWVFVESCNKKELTALYFWVLNRKYFVYMEEFECHESSFKQKSFDSKFGRELAYKIYEPNNSNLKQDTVQELNHFLCTFATELDLSSIDEYTPDQIMEVIDTYCC